MRKKLTIEYIRSEFEKEGYTLLSEEYVNVETKLNYRCAKGHEHSATWHSWQHGYRCPYCAGKKKLTYKFINEEFNKEGYTLTSKDYTNNKTKLDYTCSKGHEHSIRWCSWNNGNRCPTCAGLSKPTIEYIKESLEKEDYTLVSKEYTNNNIKLDYVCSNKHQHSMKWNKWQQGRRCPICRAIKFSGSGNPRWLGGISYEPYCEIWKDREYKQDIRERDGNKCLNPYCDSKKPEDLTIHHIDYNKKNCSPNNLITVCRTCNFKANIDRDWHTTWYQAIIKNRYGGVKKCLYQ